MPRRFMQPWRHGAPLQDLTPEDFIEPGKIYLMGHPPLMIDILPGISGVDFNTKKQSKRLFFVILSAAKHLSF